MLQNVPKWPNKGFGLELDIVSDIRDRTKAKLFFSLSASEQLKQQCSKQSRRLLNTPGCVSLQSERPPAECAGAAPAGCRGSTSCLRLRSRWPCPSWSARGSVPGWPGTRAGAESVSGASATPTLPPVSAAAAPQSAVCGCKEGGGGAGTVFSKCTFDQTGKYFYE